MINAAELSTMVATIASPYSQLAADYDATIGIPFFRQTRDFFERLVRKYGIRFRSAADIGCGTGLFARHLKLTRNISIFAVDLSEPMLRIAARNCGGTNVVLLRQDIRYLSLPHPVDLITANFDTLNHLVRTSDLRQALRRIFANLNPGGHFIFDLVTNCLPLGRSRQYVRRFDRLRRRVTQTVRLDPFRNLLSIIVSIRSPGMLTPVIERHLERVYSLKELGKAMHDAGFIIRGVHDATARAPVRGCPPRITVVAMRKTTLKRERWQPTMYLGTRNPFGQTPDVTSTLQGTLGGARTAEERIREGDFEKVLAVLAGPSPWQQYIRESLRLARQNLPSRPFRVLSRREFEQIMGPDVDVSHIPGMTDKRTGTISMLEYFGGSSQATYLHAALHEAVHLVSHPPGRGGRLHSTAWTPFGEGLLEGIVECVTIDILNEQHIALARPEMRGHEQRLPVAIEMLRRLSRPLLARVLFEGDYQQFILLMHHFYSVTGWEEIKSLTTANNPRRAIQRMNELRAAQEQRRRDELRVKMQQIPTSRTP